MAFANKVQLITYPDSLGGTLGGLRESLTRFFPGCFAGGIHVLPPFPSSGDRGFAPTTYSEIEPRFGTWAEISALAETCPVMLDLMVNHISRRSPYFHDFMEKGRDSRYAGLFIDITKVWPEGGPGAEELSALFLRRPLPYSDYRLGNGETVRLWTTFGREDPSEQVDLDHGSPVTMHLLTETLDLFRRKGVRMLRLDAVGYVVKRRGTSCFFVEPEIWDVLDRIRAVARGFGIDLLCEVHAPLETQAKLSANGYWGYDFALPFLVLDAVVMRRFTRLVRYLRIRPSQLFTQLDCHDGIPVLPDLDGLVDARDAEAIIDMCVGRGANLSRVSAKGSARPGGLDVHQIRCAYYSALACDDDAYIAARALHLFTPGIPQIYYVGLLAGENDGEGARRSGEGRDVNRHNFSMTEIGSAMGRNVVRRLLRLIRFRNESPAFDGRFTFASNDPSTLELRWESGTALASVKLDLTRYTAIVEERGTACRPRRWKA
jgi:sucrose 6(F)-phosphate phosphorylase